MSVVRVVLPVFNHQWREQERVDGILQEPREEFDIIKKYYPHFYFKQAKNGANRKAFVLAYLVCGGTGLL